ncbi:MAG TPA: DUF6600 domain-containing protein [Kofleriaceae bacterium]
MRIDKLCLAVILALPAIASAQVQVGVDVNAQAQPGDDTYDTTAPGDPIDSTDVFYDQLSPYGTWVDDPDAGRVFIPDTPNYVPYQNGYWQNSSVGFVWVSNEPYAWAVNHYGRWAYSNDYGRWYWAPDTHWGPAWVEWRQTGTHFGWAPLGPDVLVRGGWHAPIESWRYVPSEHIFDPYVSRYYEPRDRVAVIDREARPIGHYSTVSGVRCVVGPPRSMVIARHVNFRPVHVEARTVGRWNAGEVHTMTVRAQTNHASFEAANQHRIDGNAHFHATQEHVIATHPAMKEQINARVNVHENVNVHETVNVHENANVHAGGKVEAGHGPVEHQQQPAQQVHEAGHGPVEHQQQPAQHEVGHGPVEHQQQPAQQVHEAGHGPVEHGGAAQHTQPAHPATPAHTAPAKEEKEHH